MTTDAASSRPIDLLAFRDDNRSGLRGIRDLLSYIRGMLARDDPENRWDRQDDSADPGRHRWTLDERTREIGDPVDVVEVGLRDDNLSIRIIAKDRNAVFVALRPGLPQDPRAIIAAFLDMAAAVETALDVLPSDGTDDDGDRRFGTASTEWLTAASVFASRHLDRNRVEGDDRTVRSVNTPTPWSPSILTASDGRPIPVPSDVHERFDAACPSMVIVALTEPPRTKKGPMQSMLEFAPMTCRPGMALDPPNHSHDLLGTMRAIAMAVEAGAMEP